MATGQPTGTSSMLPLLLCLGNGNALSPLLTHCGTPVVSELLESAWFSNSNASQHAQQACDSTQTGRCTSS